MEVIATTRYVTLITAKKRSLRQNNIFKSILCSQGGLGISVWFHFLSLVPCSFQGVLCLVGVSVQRGLFWGSLCPGGSLSRGISVREILPSPPPGERPPLRWRAAGTQPKINGSQFSYWLPIRTLQNTFTDTILWTLFLFWSSHQKALKTGKDFW